MAWAIKGSYRCDNLLAYLRRWLTPWSPERAAANDYRILSLDLAASHVHTDVEDFCWSCGYVPLYHYGCTTGVCQVNDTDCHCAFEAAYIELEQASFFNKMLIDPGCIARTLQEVLDDTCAAW